MLIKTFITYFLLIFILTTSIRLEAAIPSIYQIQDPVQFAEYDKIPNGPYHHFSTDQISTADLNFAGVSIRTLSYMYTPIGLLFRGFFDNFNAVVQYLQKIHHLNKVALEFNLDKSVLLLPYIGPDGTELLHNYLLTKQTISPLINSPDFTFSTSHKMTALNELDQRKSGINPYLLRNLINHFIQTYQKKGLLLKELHGFQLVVAQGSDYEDHLDSFVRAFGLIVFSEETKQLGKLYIKKSEEEFCFHLYHILNQEGILTSSGGLRKKTFFTRKTIDDQLVITALKRHHIISSSLTRSILHDLGFITSLDMQEVHNSLELNLDLLKKDLTVPFAQILEKRLDLIEKSFQNFKTQFYNNKDSDDLKEVLELSLLSALIDKNHLNEYRLRHIIPPKDNGLADSIAVHKLAFLDQFDQKDYHYFMFEKDLQIIVNFIYSELDKKNIVNENFQILSMKGEDNVVASLTFIRGLGFTSTGILRLLPILFSTALTAADVSSLFLAQNSTFFITRILSIILHGIRLHHAIYNLIDLKIKSHILSLLSNYFQNLSSLWESNSPLKEQNTSYVNELKYTLFSLKAQEFMKGQQKRLFMHQVGMESVWITLNTISMLSVIASFILIILGLFLSISIVASQFTLGVTLLSGLLALPFIYLIMRESTLIKNLNLLSMVSNRMHHGFTMKDGVNYTRRQEDLMGLFISDTSDYMFVMKNAVHLQQDLQKLTGQTNPEKMHKTLASIFKSRRRGYEKFIRLWDNVKDHPSKVVLLKNELGVNTLSKEEWDSWWKRLKPAYHATGIDHVMKWLDPTHDGLSTEKSQNYPHTLPEMKYDDYLQDIHLTNLFVYVYSIYNSTLKNMIEYSYLLKKDRLQSLYFDMHVTNREIELLKTRLKKRMENIFEPHNIEVINENRFILKELHPLLPLNDSSFWNNNIINELETIFSFNKDLYKASNNFLDFKDYENLKFPPTPSIDKLLELYLPQRNTKLQGIVKKEEKELSTNYRDLIYSLFP